MPKIPKRKTLVRKLDQIFSLYVRTRDADKSRRFNITGLSVGLAKRLSVPDDYFTLSQALSFQHYNLKNYN